MISDGPNLNLYIYIFFMILDGWSVVYSNFVCSIKDYTFFLCRYTDKTIYLYHLKDLNTDTFWNSSSISLYNYYQNCYYEVSIFFYLFYINNIFLDILNF